MQRDYIFPEIEEAISSLLKFCLVDLGIVTSQDIVVEIPKDDSWGDLSTNLAMRIASEVKKSPKETAEILIPKVKEKLKEFNLNKIIGEVKLAPPGFINFYLKEDLFINMVKGIVTNGKLERLNTGKVKRVQLEFVSANPTGPLSIAHARQAAVGDSLARVLKMLGFQVTREYYNNDEGNQIDTLGKSVELRSRELKGETITFPEDYYQGEYIISLAKETIDRNLGLVDYKDYAVFAANKITDIIKKELSDFGVIFDIWYSQKKLCHSEKIESVLSLLKEKGFIYESEGALWFKSTAFGDDKDRVVVKSDKKYTYLAPDIAYHQDKFKRGFEWVINIWGPDHHGYIPRIKAAVRALGYNQSAISVIIVQLATIYRDGKPVAMSTRRGQYITLREVLDEVGRDASRFFLLMRRTDSHLDFDLELAKKQTPENPVYYIQYAYARMSGILNNTQDTKIELSKIDLSLLKEKEEKELLRLIFQFYYALSVCLRQLDPYPLTAYLQSLATAFHRFYDRHRVLGVGEDLTLSRLALIKCLKIVLAEGLDLVGVSKPETM